MSFKNLCIILSNENAKSSNCIGKYHINDLDIEAAEKVEIKDRSFPKLEYKNFDKLPDTMRLKNLNNRVHINLNFEDDSEIPKISGGPLSSADIYFLDNLYFNWLNFYPDNYQPNDLYLSAELHLVFYNTKMGDFENALKQNDGIAIMAFRLDKPYPKNKTNGMEIIASRLNFISFEGAFGILEKPLTFTLNDLVSSKSPQFQYTYSGTMIDGDCSNNVIWLDYEEKIQITEEEIREFFHLKTANGKEMLNTEKRYSQPKGVVYKNASDTLSTNILYIILILVLILFAMY